MKKSTYPDARLNNKMQKKAITLKVQYKAFSTI